MADEAYADLERALMADGIRCQFQTPGQFVISAQVGPIWPDRGNCFWVTRAGGQWHLFTWAPVGYLLGDPARIADLCRAFMAASKRAAAVVPVNIATEFGLSRLSEAEKQAVYDAMLAK